MEPADVPFDLGDAALLAGYDRRSVQRGVRYVAEGRVGTIDVGEEWISGDVQGTRRTPYRVEVSWVDHGTGARVSHDECTCPLGGSCKHAVALVVHVARARQRSVTAARPGSSTSTRPAARAERHADALAKPTRRTPPASWRTVLDKVVPKEVADATPMALQFTVQTPSATRWAPDPTTRVTIRPLRTGSRGKWVKTGAEWRDVLSGYGWNLREADPAHVAALKSVAGDSVSPYASSSPVMLDRLKSTMWTGLRNAADAGVVLVDGKGQETVVLADSPARLHFDLTAADDGSVTVHTRFVRDGAAVESDPAHTGTIGSPPHGLFVVEDERLLLVPLAAPVDDTVVPLIGGPPLRVPASDVDDLVDDYLPTLARIAPVGSSDGSVTIEAPELTGLVALVDHTEVGTVGLRWAARYRRGERTLDHLVGMPGGSGRDRAAERVRMGELELPTHLLAELVDPLGRPTAFTTSGPDAITLLTEVVPWLEDRGQVVVEVSGDAPPLRRATGDPLVTLAVSDPTAGGDDEAGNDWFDLSVRVSVDGEPIEFAHLFTALALERPALILPSGTWLPLDRPELDRLRELIDEARGLAESDGDAVRINRFQTDWWDELSALGVVESQSTRWADNVERMRTLSAPEPVTVPARLDAELRHYQQDGLDWLAFLHRSELGGILADDMGLGKTLQTIALFLHVLDDDPDARFLVVAPTSVVANWHREVEHFAPDLSVRTITETARRRGTTLAEDVGDARVVVTSYALFRIEFDEYATTDWEMLVLDEAQFVKNHRGKTYQCVRRLQARTKLAITGTPIENSLMDLWSLLSIVAPGLYPDPTRFSEVYRKPIESGRAPERLATLRRRITPLMRRRTKDEVLTELPPKIEQVIDVELSPAHMRIYQRQLQQQRRKILGLVDDMVKNRFEILKSLTILRQMSLDPGLVDPDHDGVGSAKLDRLVDDLTQVVAEGHRALVFSTFTRYLTRVKARLDDAGIGYSYLDGRTRRRDRAVSAFVDGDVPVFVISLKAGGFGLNLTQADYCFVLDPWWNPAAETQAVDRAHRIGQTSSVVVYRYVSTGTIEDKVMELKERKAALFSSVMDADDALAGPLQADDVRSLFETGP